MDKPKNMQLFNRFEELLSTKKHTAACRLYIKCNQSLRNQLKQFLNDKDTFILFNIAAKINPAYCTDTNFFNVTELAHKGYINKSVIKAYLDMSPDYHDFYTSIYFFISRGYEKTLKSLHNESVDFYIDLYHKTYDKKSE